MCTPNMQLFVDDYRDRKGSVFGSSRSKSKRKMRPPEATNTGAREGGEGASDPAPWRWPGSMCSALVAAACPSWPFGQPGLSCCCAAFAAAPALHL